jgi:Sulfotransferase family
MIVSHRYRFIFLKSKKTAGTSVELALSACCGPDDIITPLTEEEELLRQGLPARNFMRHSMATDIRRFVLSKILRQRKHKVDFYDHMKADLARAYLGPATWNTYFKFTVERNPWDRQVSYWQYRIGKTGNQDMSFREFIDTSEAFVPSRRIYMIADRLAVDHVIRYEHLENDLDEVCRYLQVGEKMELPRAKGAFRRVGDYREQYDDYSREWVARSYKPEIDLFGYHFDTPSPTLLDGRINRV